MARKILLADDSVTAQNMGRKILADAGYEVITVNNGSAALKKVAEARPDLIVLDVYMPGYSGLEVCQRLKETGDTARIPILLTVGKLEPFKPEEARRVRAEGFIVKPFEASELLSALTKLEDKMVPRGESSKPGRFARAIAAVEEGRYDKTMAADEDSGWKSRLSFPSKKNKKAEAEDTTDSEIYNPVNKDLRTVLDPKSAPAQPPKAQETKQETKDESRIDVGALAPEGLPKDVTPEEIAALAAAAAQIQGKLAETKTADTNVAEGLEKKTAETGIAEAQPSAIQPLEVQPVEVKSVEIKPADVKPAEANAPDIASESKTSEIKAIEPAPGREMEAAKSEPKTEAAAIPVAEEAAAGAKEQALAAAVGSSSVISASETAATFVGQSSASSSLEVSAAIDAIQSAGFVPPPSSERNFEAAHDRGQHAEPEPVTMAMAAAAAQGSPSSRWTAVSIPLAPEESSVALEDEMRKAHAAEATPAIGESRPAEAAPSLAETESADSKFAETKLAPDSIPSEIQSVPAAAQRTDEMPNAPTPAEPEAAQSISAAASDDAEPLRAAAKNFEAVTVPAVEAQTITSAEPGPYPAESFEPPISASKSLDADAVARESEPERPEIPITHVASSQPPVAYEVDSSHREQPQEVAGERAKYEEAVPQADLARETESVPAITAPAASVDEMPITGTQESEISQQTAAVDFETAAKPSPSVEAVPAEKHNSANSEHDIAATTAAAWASWRRVRESGDSKDATQSGHLSENRSSRDEAAMAAAAGAENAGEESPELASIVDSVLADLRPKIVEEISKKLKKK